MKLITLFPLLLNILIKTNTQNTTTDEGHSGYTIITEPIDHPKSKIKTWDDVINYTKKQKDKISITISTEDGKFHKSINGERMNPVGSAYKLYILGALTEKIKKGKMKWSDKYPFVEKWKSIEGDMDFPNGTLINLKDYAYYMINSSDNTATDHLMYLLTKETVEKQLYIMKNSNPVLSFPSITTLEFHLIKWGLPKAEIAKYIKGDVKYRRKILKEKVSKMTIDQYKTNGVSQEVPAFINEIEWFASSDNLCTAMYLLKAYNDKGTMDVLQWKSDFALKFDEWSYMGFKPGGEPGVYSLTYLLQGKNKGKWGCASFSFTNDKKDITHYYYNDFAYQVADLLKPLLDGKKVKKLNKNVV